MQWGKFSCRKHRIYRQLCLCYNEFFMQDFAFIPAFLGWTHCMWIIMKAKWHDCTVPTVNNQLQHHACTQPSKGGYDGRNLHAKVFLSNVSASLCAPSSSFFSFSDDYVRALQRTECVCMCVKVNDGEERRLRRVRDESAASLLGAVRLLPGVTSTPLAHLLSSLRQAAATHTHTKAAVCVCVCELTIKTKLSNKGEWEKKEKRHSWKMITDR